MKRGRVSIDVGRGAREHDPDIQTNTKSPRFLFGTTPKVELTEGASEIGAAVAPAEGKRLVVSI